jgi:hypothetical protein
VLSPVIEFKVRGPQRRPSPRIVSDSDESGAAGGVDFDRVDRQVDEHLDRHVG